MNTFACPGCDWPENDTLLYCMVCKSEKKLNSGEIEIDFIRGGKNIMKHTTIILTLKRGDDIIEVTRKIKGNNIIDIIDSIQEIVLDSVIGARLHSIYFYETEEKPCDAPAAE